MSARDAGQASSSSLNSRSGSRYALNEETPLLQLTSRPSFVGDESERTGALLETAALVDRPRQEPRQPEKPTSVTRYPSGKAVVNDSDSKDNHHSIQPADQDSPYLCGVSKWRFWVLFSGVMVQSFVRV